ncbi:aminopeptidase N [Desulfolithobacter sp.]
MTGEKQQTIYLRDYTPPPYLVDSVDLRVELDPDDTLVRCRLAMRPNPDYTGTRECVLDGEQLELVMVKLDRVPLSTDQYSFDQGKLYIFQVPDESFVLELETRINPAANTALEGLYLSNGNYCTQCEAEGFRRITCFPDRPDVMAVYTTTVVAEKGAGEEVVLLSNGNLVLEGELEDGRRFATWHDPFPKPSYLFALVAGRLVCLEDFFTTMSGREVILRIYVEERNREKCGHAMASLKKAMRWDEEQYGREYDLDVYMIVAVDDFNMGAMENKGLNIFNSKYVLARPETATDSDYDGIEGVIAHEYFHNWTGNRITCRDWFQLSLKEGLTVFRDQEFSADMTSRPVKRIQDVNVIRSFQFREDGGPMAHPVRPESYQEINNFYTLTVYNKGAEVIRMLHTFLGPERFRRGMDLYFDRYDGQAVTCDDFVQAMADAAGRDLTGFKGWYSQAGTPVLDVEKVYDPAARKFELTVRQFCPPTPGQSVKKPFSMPLAVGLLDGQGRDMSLILDGEGEVRGTTAILVLSGEEQRFSFTGVDEKPVLSFLRNFSAPVRVRMQSSDEELAFRMAHDRDLFNRWDAGQQLGMKYLLQEIHAWRPGGPVSVPEPLLESFGRILGDREADQAFVALAMQLPTENWISEQLEVIDPEAVFEVRLQFRHAITRALRDELLDTWLRLESRDPYRYSAREAGRRSLRNCCLEYLLVIDSHGMVDRELLALGVQQFRNSNNMTEVMAALRAVVNADRASGDALLDDFYGQWHGDPLVVDKWLMLQATCSLPGTLDRVMELTRHPAFSEKNPNKVRALIGAFCQGNQVRFHARDGRGYRFLADWILRLDRLNPQIAARLVTPLTMWRRYDQERRQLMEGELKRLERAKLSRDVREMVEKSLKQPGN